MKSQLLNTELVSNARAALTAQFSRLDEQANFVETRSVAVRGGQYGTSASLAILRAFVESGIVGYTALQDGVQLEDISALTKLYPHGVTLVQNWQTAKVELGELDIVDITTIVRELCNITEQLASSLVKGQELPVRSSITPEIAWKAAQQSLLSTRDIVKIGISTFKTGFDITKIPQLFTLFPHATALASNAPVAVQSFAMLNLQQKGELTKLGVDVVVDILSFLQTA